MILPPKVIHPTGEPEFTPKKSEISALIADTFNGKIHIEEYYINGETNRHKNKPSYIQY